MALATIEDINTHLPDDKLAVDDAIDDKFQIDAERVIKALLSGTYQPTTLAGWADPDTTPDTIRAIAGRLIAASYFAQRYAIDITDENNYAQMKYNEAMALLGEIRAGTVVVEGVVETVSPRFSSLDFWPNDTTDEPFFRMDLEFG